MAHPLVSIVVCCHNRRHYLEQTLESIFAQEYEPVEIIVMDDGSTDGTEEMMANYAGKVRYFWQQSQGVAVARTNASRIATGEYIAYQDDDDLMPRKRIVNLYDALKQYPGAIFASADFALIDSEGNLTGHRWMPENTAAEGKLSLFEDGQAAVLWPRIPAVPHTTLFRTEYGEKIGWFDPEFRYACSDADFLARLGRLGPVVYYKGIVSLYRRGHQQLWADDVRTGCSRVQLWEKHLGLISPDKRELNKRLQTRLRQVLISLDSSKRTGKLATDLPVEDYLEKGLSLLGPRERLLFEAHSRIKHPLRDLVKKCYT